MHFSLAFSGSRQQCTDESCDQRALRNAAEVVVGLQWRTQPREGDRDVLQEVARQLARVASRAD